MPDGTGGHYAQNRGRIIQACETHWKEKFGDCSGFLKSVATEVGVFLPNKQANEIYDYLKGKPAGWDMLGTGAATGVIAGVAGSEGKLVVAAWKNASGHGHVAIVVDFSQELSRAMAYWGSLGGVGKTYAKITSSFSQTKLKDTLFAAHALGKLPA